MNTRTYDITPYEHKRRAIAEIFANLYFNPYHLKLNHSSLCHHIAKDKGKTFSQYQDDLEKIGLILALTDDGRLTLLDKHDLSFYIPPSKHMFLKKYLKRCGMSLTATTIDINTTTVNISDFSSNNLIYTVTKTVMKKSDCNKRKQPEPSADNPTNDATSKRHKNSETTTTSTQEIADTRSPTSIAQEEEIKAIQQVWTQFENTDICCKLAFEELAKKRGHETLDSYHTYLKSIDLCLVLFQEYNTENKRRIFNADLYNLKNPQDKQTIESMKVNVMKSLQSLLAKVKEHGNTEEDAIKIQGYQTCLKSMGIDINTVDRLYNTISTTTKGTQTTVSNNNNATTSQPISLVPDNVGTSSNPSCLFGNPNAQQQQPNSLQDLADLAAAQVRGPNLQQYQ